MQWLLLLLSAASLCAADQPWVFCQAGIPVQSAYAQPTDRVQLYFLQAPALERQYGSLFQYFGILHVALGIHNSNTGLNYTIEYYATTSVLRATLPIIVKDDDNQTSLLWKNGGYNCLTPVMNLTYYSAGVTYVGEITGTQLNGMLNYAATVDNKTYPEYQLFFMSPNFNFSAPNPMNAKFFVRASTCDDFVWRCLNFLHKAYNYTSFAVQNLPRDFAVWTMKTPPVVVNYTDASWHEAIVGYYEEWQISVNDPLKKWIQFIEDIIEGEKFTHGYGNYWLMNNLIKPYFRMAVLSTPIISDEF